MKLLSWVGTLIPNLFRWGIISRWLIALCLWVSAIQLTYPVLSPWSLTGTITTTVVALCLLVLLIRIAERISPNRQMWMIVRPFLHVGDFVALAYIVCGVGLYLNGILATAPPQKHVAEVLTAAEEPISLGPWGPAGHLQIMLQGADAVPQYVFVDDRVFQRILPGQGISLVIYEGAFGVRWVDAIVPDYTKTLAMLVEKGIHDPMLRKQAMMADLAEQRFEKVFRQAQQYFNEEPGDIAFALNVAGTIGQLGQRALAVQLLEPIANTHANYKLYCTFGALIRDTGDVQKGIEYLNAATRMNPEATEAYYLLGHTYKQIGQKDEAHVAFTKLVELEPRYRALLQQ